MDGEPIESPDHCSEEEHAPTEQTEEATLLEDKGVPYPLDHIMKATGILSSLLREMITVGVTQSWDTSKDSPEEKFVDIEGEHLKETVERLVPRDDRNLVYRMLQGEVSAKKDRDKIVGDILLKFAFPYYS